MNPVRISPVATIQQAVYQRLSADAVLIAAITGVFDEVPEGTTRPYVVIGDAVDTPANCHDGYGSHTVITVHVWSDYAGFAEPLSIQDRIAALLDHQPLTVNGHTVVVVRHEQTMPLRDPDPRIRHVTLRFLVITEQEM